MPAKGAQSFNITLNTGDSELFNRLTLDTFRDLIKSKLAISKYAICGEMASFPHYHAAVVTTDVERQDKIKDRLLTVFKQYLKSQGFDWTSDNDKHALKVNYHPDIHTLAGGYCAKDQTGGYEVYGFTDEEMATGKDRYSTLLAEKKKKIPVSRSGLLLLMKETFQNLWESIAVDAHKINIWEKKSNKQKMDFLNSLIIHEGYDTSLVDGTLQWKSIERNFNSHFHPEDHEIFLDDFWEKKKISQA